MTVNVGLVDRAIRFILGVVLIAAPFIAKVPLFDVEFYKYISIAVGVVMVAVALTRVCPLYSIFGIKTCR